MLKKYFCAGLVGLALLGGCSGDSYTTTDTASTRTATTRVEDRPGASVATSADGNPQTGSSTHVSVHTDSPAGASSNSTVPGSASTGTVGDMSSVDTTDNATPATYGQSLDSDNAEQVADNTGTASAIKAGSDSSFATEAAQGGMKEVQLGRLASEKGSNAKVKQFAQQMVTDHSKANDELKSLAQKQGLTLPPADSQTNNEHGKLSKLSGAEFDREYADMMVKDHEKTVALFEKESQSGQNQALKSWAAEKLPTLKHHLQMARDLLASLK